MTLREWLLFTDRHEAPYEPFSADSEFVLTNRFWRSNLHGTRESTDWMMEEWFVTSVLVPVEQLDIAASKLDANGCPGTGWLGRERFEFGDYEQVRGINTYGWVFSWPEWERVETVQLRQDFMLYHALRQQQPGMLEHPLDGLAVARVQLIQEHELHAPTPHVVVHRDYLRDYLAAKHQGLIICIVADRFAHSANQEELGIDRELPETRIDANTSIRLDLSPADSHDIPGVIRARATLWRNVIVPPYEKPRADRSPWHCPEPAEEQEAGPTSFILDAESNRGSLLDRACPMFLFFKPEVLRRYLHEQGYTVGFVTRTWGQARGPKGPSIDLGINAAGLVTAYVRDLRRLSATEQAYWAGFSSLPSRGVCEDLFQTRFQNDPPHSPGVVDLIQTTMGKLNEAFEQNFERPLLTDREMKSQDMMRLSIGPLGSDPGELLQLARLCYQETVERVSVEALRGTLPSETYDKDAKSIALLESLMVQEGLKRKEARRVVAPLRALNELRIGAAHPKNVNLQAVFVDMTGAPPPATLRNMYDVCIDAVVYAFQRITQALHDSRR